MFYNKQIHTECGIVLSFSEPENNLMVIILSLIIHIRKLIMRRPILKIKIAKGFEIGLSKHYP